MLAWVERQINTRFERAPARLDAGPGQHHHERARSLRGDGIMRAGEDLEASWQTYSTQRLTS